MADGWGDARKGVWVTAALGVTVTAVVAATPVQLAYRSPLVQPVVSSTVALVSLALAVVMVGRVRLHQRRRDLLLAYAFFLQAITSIAVRLVPSLVAPASDRGTLADWTAALVGLVVVLAVTAAATTRDGRRLRRTRRPATAAGVAAIATVGVVGLLVAVAMGSSDLPPVVAASLSPEDSRRPLIAGHAVMFGIQLVAAGLYLLAALGFTRRHGDERDGLSPWLGAFAALMAGARLNYALFPSLYSEWFYVGDIFRLGAFAMLLVAAGVELRGYWAGAADAAVLAERRRLARDLHDGLAQELAFIARESWRLSEQGIDGARAIASGAERALDEARAAIAALSLAPEEPLDIALGRMADDLEHRLGVRVQVRVPDGVAVPAPVREALLRVAREAATNAVRHGGATTVNVSVATGGGVRLVVADDGAGFDPEMVAERGVGFGITAMRERVAALGGTLRIEAGPGTGARVEAVVP